MIENKSDNIKKPKKIGVFGLWHLGSVLTAVWSKMGNEVIGFDYDTKIVENLKKGKPPIFEPDLEQVIKDGLNKNLLKYSSYIEDMRDCDYVFLSYDTPVDEEDNSDVTILIKSIEDLKKILKDNSIIIISSQSPISLSSVLRKILKEQNPSLDLAYSPENLRLGEAIKCYLEPGRIILGANNEDTEKKCIELFNRVNGEIISMSLESAEMVKHGINSFLATSIVFANHLSDICSEKGADIKDVIKGIKSDPRIGEKAYLSPGIGFSGATLGRDLRVLQKANGEGFAKLFGTIYDYNLERKHSIINKMIRYFGKLNNKKIGVIGLTYKPGTSTLRRSLPIEIIDVIIERGGIVKAFDPKADYNELKNNIKFEICNSIEEVSKDVDFIVLLTEWPEFKEFDWSKIDNKIRIFDTKNFLDRDNIIKRGFRYYSI